ncbi:MAG: phosphoribosylglycinamide formyltransferase [Cyclobacteriaceae bacterium]
MTDKKRIAILASGSGTNAEQIVKHFDGHRDIEVALILSNNPDAFVLERAKRLQVPSKAFGRNQFRESEVLKWLAEYAITHVVLAGFLWLIPSSWLQTFPNRIINIHPALLPKYGGKGMYGENVHKAVKEAGDNETGITIHLVNAHYDEGKMLFQAKCIIADEDSPADIAAKVHQLEYQHYPSQIEKWILGS